MERCLQNRGHRGQDTPQRAPRDGRYIIEKTDNVAAVQRQLGHKNAAYSMQYSRITDEELNVILDGR